MTPPLHTPDRKGNVCYPKENIAIDECNDLPEKWRVNCKITLERIELLELDKADLRQFYQKDTQSPTKSKKIAQIKQK